MSHLPSCSRRTAPPVSSLLLALGLALPGVVSSDAQAQSVFDRMRERAAARAQSQTESKAGQQVDSAVDETVDCMFDPIECAKKAKPAEPPAGPEKPAQAVADAAQWYAEQDGSRVGPMPRSQLDSMVVAGQVTATTLVWREGLADWTAAGQVPELAEDFKKIPPPLPKASGPPPLPTGTGRAAPPMKSHTEYLTLSLPARMAFENITPQVEAVLARSGIREGLLLCNAMHITASVFINDDESGLHADFTRWLEGLAPFDASPRRYAHNRTGEDNADAHMKRQIMGREVVVAITEGKLDFGPWEQIFYGEFDGRRPKRVLVKLIGE